MTEGRMPAILAHYGPRWRGLAADALAFRHGVAYSPGGCWLWQPLLGYGGYGVTTWRTRQVRAHVLAYALVNGWPPAGRQVRHTCGDRSCVNPAHLKLAPVMLTGPEWMAENGHRTNATGECVIWQGRVSRGGYGVTTGGRLAHRVALEQAIGSLDGLVAMHSCDCPPCVNLDHLRAGTPAENTADRDRKGRQVSVPHRAKLTSEQVSEIKRRYRARSATDGAGALAAEFGVCSSTIQKAAKR